MNDNSVLVNHFIREFQDIQNGKLWMGQSYKVKLASLTEKEAFYQPLNELHSVAQLIAHLTAWRKDAMLKLVEGTGKLRDDSPENWPDNEYLKSIGWNSILQQYDQSLEELLQFLDQKTDDFLITTYYDQDFEGEFEHLFLVKGLLHHDIYHLGQIGLIIRMIKEEV